MTIDEMIAVLQAAKEGKTILDGEGRIANIEQRCAGQNYRVKSEPLEIEVWVIEDDNYIEIARSYHDPSHYKGWKKKKFREVIE